MPMTTGTLRTASSSRNPATAPATLPCKEQRQGEVKEGRPREGEKIRLVLHLQNRYSFAQHTLKVACQKSLPRDKQHGTI